VPNTIRRVLPVLGLTVFSSNLANGIIAPLLPIYAETLGASGLWLGVIFAGVSIASAIFMPFTGRLSDRRGRKLVLMVGLIGLSLTSFGYLWADSIARLTAVRFLQGAASAMVGPIAQAYIGDVTPPGEEGKWMGLFNATFIIGFGSGPLLGGVVGDRFGTDTAFYIMGGLNLVSFLGVAFFLPEVVQRKKTAGRFSLKAVTSSNLTRGVFSYQVGASANRGIMTAFIPVFASLYLGLSTSVIGLVLTVSIVINSLLLVPAGALADRLNRRYMILFGCSGVALSMFVLPLASGLWVLLALIIMGGVFDACATPPSMAFMVEEGRKQGMGVTTSIVNMGGGLGMGLAPILAGLVVDASDVRSAFYVAGALVVLAALVFRQFTRSAPFKKAGTLS
jgi:MFS transporter, DHA1 family, multidrug resistance protein